MRLGEIFGKWRIFADEYFFPTKFSTDEISTDKVLFLKVLNQVVWSYGLGLGTVGFLTEHTRHLGLKG